VLVSFRKVTAAADLPPCFSAFIRLRILPSGLFGPVLVAHGFVRTIIPASMRHWVALIEMQIKFEDVNARLT
jgi:hypothetical protein